MLAMFAGPVLLIVGVFNRRSASREISQLALLGFLLAALPLYQNLFIAVTLNEPQNAEPFIGFILCLLISAVLLLRKLSYSVSFRLKDAALTVGLPSRKVVTILAAAAFLVMIGWVLGEGVNVARFRIVQEFNYDTRFVSRLNVPGLERVYWGEPTQIPTRNGPVVIQEGDFEGLVRYLESRPANFFVAGDATLLYGILHRESPQPLLYFQPGHSFTAEDIPRLDQAILHALQARNIRNVVREEFAFLGTEPAYAIFPHTWAWLNQEFRPARQFGIFKVWERKPGADDRTRDPSAGP